MMKLLMLIFLIVGAAAAAEADEHSPIIDAENITRLTPVVTVDFADFPPELTGPVDSGWFTLNAAGEYAAVIRRDGGLVVFDAAGDLTDTYAVQGDNGDPATVLDATFGADGHTLAALHADGTAYYISITEVSSGHITLMTLPETTDSPVRIWLDETLEHAWLEVLGGDAETEHYVIRLPLPGIEDEVITLPSGPENDAESYVRIGRIPAPLAITSTLEGVVKLWNLETGEITAEIQLDGIPVFGRVNETTGQQLAWRDPQSETLQLLDFATGENVLVAPLGGEYIQAILLGAAGDVILGVAIGDDPVVAAWDVATGDYTVLGEYRPCSRVPDMVRLSADGTTLVIGCDAGLEFWRIR
jgi:WD40 repeat protein